MGWGCPTRTSAPGRQHRRPAARREELRPGHKDPRQHLPALLPPGAVRGAGLPPPVSTSTTTTTTVPKKSKTTSSSSTTSSSTSTTSTTTPRPCLRKRPKPAPTWHRPPAGRTTSSRPPPISVPAVPAAPTTRARAPILPSPLCRARPSSRISPPHRSVAANSNATALPATSWPGRLDGTVPATGDILASARAEYNATSGEGWVVNL